LLIDVYQHTAMDTDEDEDAVSVMEDDEDDGNSACKASSKSNTRTLFKSMTTELMTLMKTASLPW
jgi:hypothetical protein